MELGGPEVCSAREQPPLLLEEGSTCWRVTRAARVALLIDGAAYFDALRRALPLARRSIDIVGWDIRSDISLDPLGDAQPLRKFLRGLLAARPTLRIRILVWDWTVFFSLDREPLPQLQFGVAQTRRLDLVLDANHPAAACHHEKIVVVDGCLAFCGGIDLTAGRWDRPAHHPHEPARGQIGRTPRPPFHDCMLMVEGEPARALDEHVRERWYRATGEHREPPREDGRRSLWPDGVGEWFGSVPVGIARTRPAWGGQAPAREIEGLVPARDRGGAPVHLRRESVPHGGPHSRRPGGTSGGARRARGGHHRPQAVRRFHRDRHDGSRPGTLPGPYARRRRLRPLARAPSGQQRGRGAAPRPSTCTASS